MSATPPCPHFGPCGGCQLQDLAYPAQLQLKAAQLRTALGDLALPELQLHASPPFGYRNRIRLTLGTVDGTLRAGYMGNGEEESQPGPGADFLPIAQCPIAAPILWRAAEAFLALANDQSAIWLNDPRLTPDQLELFTTAGETALQLTLYLRTSAKSLPAKLTAAFTALCESLQAQLPQLSGAAIALLPPQTNQRSRRNEVTRPGPNWGAPGLNYTVAATQPATYWVPRTAFFQVNRFLLPELLALVATTAERCADTSLAWDLYAGVGLFSRVLARSFTRVTAVEIAESSAVALAATKLPNLHAVKSPTLDFLRTAVLQRDRPSFLILDPPRSGAGTEVCELLARIAAPTLVYVSCSPHALAADLAALTASGYAVSQLHLFDLFPQTAHMETVAILTRKAECWTAPT